jgi:hypothetical protein
VLRWGSRVRFKSSFTILIINYTGRIYFLIRALSVLEVLITVYIVVLTGRENVPGEEQAFVFVSYKNQLLL